MPSATLPTPRRMLVERGEPSLRADERRYCGSWPHGDSNTHRRAEHDTLAWRANCDADQHADSYAHGYPDAYEHVEPHAGELANGDADQHAGSADSYSLVDAEPHNATDHHADGHLDPGTDGTSDHRRGDDRCYRRQRAGDVERDSGEPLHRHTGLPTRRLRR